MKQIGIAASTDRLVVQRVIVQLCIAKKNKIEFASELAVLNELRAVLKKIRFESKSARLEVQPLETCIRRKIGRERILSQADRPTR